MKSRTTLFFAFLAVLAVLFVLPGAKKSLVDIISGQTVTDFKLVWPSSRYVWEPLVGFEEYILSLTSYGWQMFSWVMWILVVVVGWYVSKRRFDFFAIGRSFLFSLLIFVSVIVIVLMAPLPSPRLLVPDGYSTADFHSHTYYSYDAFDSPRENERFHSRLGFNFFFNTDQQTTEGFSKYDTKARFARVFPGAQVRSQEGNALLILGNSLFDAKEFHKKPNKEIIERAHERKFLVICPHWWKWRIPPIDDLARMGIDGFEIYNPGYKNVTEAERRSIIDLCIARKLIMTSATDWHGWGSMSNTWTVMKGSYPAITSNILEHIRKSEKTYVVAWVRPEIQSRLRYFFEPFFAMYYYFTNIERVQYLAWVVWACIVFLASYAVKRISIILSAAFLAAGTYYSIMSFLIRGNETFLPLLVPILLLLACSWFVAWKIKIRAKAE